jgi:two-component system cell cycle sensor histidine kinase/response regulator CckA
MTPPDPTRPPASDPFRLLVETVPDYAIYLLDPAGRIVSWNAGAERIKGHTAAAAVGRPFAAMFTAEDVAAGVPGRKLAAALADGRCEEEGWRRRKDGSTYWAVHTVTALYEGGRHVGFGVIVRDVTDRKRAEEASADRELRLQTALDAGRMGAWAWDIRADRSTWSPRMYDLFGLPPGGGVIDSREFFDRIHPDDLPGLRRSLADAVGRGAEYRAEFRIVRQDGAVRWLAGDGRITRTEAGRPAEMYGVNYDITDRKRAEEELQRSVDHFRLALAAARMGAWSWDVAAHETTYSEELGTLFGLPGGAGTLSRDVFLGRIHPDDRPGFDAMVRGVLERDRPYLADYRAVWPDGTVRWLSSRGRVHRDAAGKPARVVGVVMDITDRRAAEAALRKSEARFRVFMDHTPAQAWITDEDGVCRFANAALAADLGRPVDGIVGRPLAAIRPGVPVGDYLASDRRVLDAAEPFQAVVPAPRRDGTVGRFLVCKFPLAPAPDGRRQVGGVAIDVTDRERAAEALRESEERYRGLLESVPAVVWVYDGAGRPLHFNRRWFEYTGQTPEAVAADRWHDAVHPDDAGRALARWAECKRANQPYAVEYRLRRTDGAYRWHHSTGTPVRTADGRVAYWIGTAFDIDDRKRAEDAVRESEAKFRALFDTDVVPIGYWHADGRITEANPAYLRLTGYEPDDLAAGRVRWDALTPPEYLAREEAAVRQVTTTGHCEPYEKEYVRKDGTRVPVLIAAGLLPGHADRGVGFALDLTELRRTEAALRILERAVRATSQGVVITDPTLPDNPTVYVNPSMEAMTGHPAGELVGRNMRFLQGQQTDPAAVRTLREAVRDGRECAVELINYRKDGTPFWNALAITPVRNAAGKLVQFVGVHADVTERRRMERALLHAQQMETVGRLAGGIAHDFNNLLTVVRGNCDLMLMDLPADDPNREMVVEVREAADRAAGLTRQLLAFGRREVIDPVVLDLNAAVAQTQRILLRLIGEDIRLAFVLDPDLPPVLIDPGQVDQILMNLCVNARDAMPTGGNLTVETRAFAVEAGPAAYPGLAPGPYARLTVTDTGCGMTPDVKAHAFEPFFTTKPPGKGTGLGLATVHGIVKQNRGHVGVYSEVGVGTTFAVLLPAVAPAPASEADTPAPSLAGGTETLLLVEDEAGVRRVARTALAVRGYAVLEAGTGEEALAVAAAHPGPIHLLVTDVVMPGMGGRHLAEAMRARHPGVRVLFMSGYTDDTVMRHGILAHDEHFLQKPFVPRGLARKVREVLDAPPPTSAGDPGRLR